MKLRYAYGHTELVNFQFLGDLEEKIDTSLCEWWLSDIEFSPDCEEFHKMRDWVEDSTIWYLIDVSPMLQPRSKKSKYQAIEVLANEYIFGTQRLHSVLNKF